MDTARYSTYDIRIRVVKATLLGQRKTDVAKTYQVDYTTLYRWCKRYDTHKNLLDLQRLSGSGRPNILDDRNRKLLMDIVMKPASNFGYETDFWICQEKGTSPDLKGWGLFSKLFFLRLLLNVFLDGLAL